MAIARMAEVVALEPDVARCKFVHDAFHSPPEVTILNSMSKDYIEANPGKKFDLINLSMVIQHVPTTVCTELMKDISMLLSNEGVAVISTTHGVERTRGFRLSKAPDRISRADYNKYAESIEEQTSGLPVRRFSRQDLEQEVAPFFEIIQWTQYCYYRPEKVGWFCANLQAEPEDLVDVANSQFVIVRKTRS